MPISDPLENIKDPLEGIVDPLEKKSVLPSEPGGFKLFPSSIKEAGQHFVKGLTLPLTIAGGIAGSAGSPVIGTALGAAAGERVGRTIESLAGVSPPQTLEEATKETALTTGTSMLPGLPGAAKRGYQAYQSLFKEPVARLGNVTKAVGGKAGPTAAGELSTQSARKGYTNLVKQGNVRYEVAKSLTPTGAETHVESTLDAANRIINDQSITEPQIKSLARAVIDKLTPKSKNPMLHEMLTGKAPTSPPTTFGDAYGVRSMLSKATSKEGNMGHYANEMLDALHDDLTAGAQRLNIPQVNKAYQDAIGFWRDKVVPQRQISKVLAKKSPETIPFHMLSNVSNARKVVAGLPPEELQSLKQGIFTRLAEGSKTSQEAIDKIRGTILAKEEVMTQGGVFTREEMDALKLAAFPSKFGKYLEEHPRVRWMIKWIPVGMALEVGRRMFPGAAITGHHPMESRSEGGPVSPAMPLSLPFIPAMFNAPKTPNVLKVPSVPDIKPSDTKSVPDTRGILNKPDIDMNQESEWARQAMTQGMPRDNVINMFRQRTGQEWKE